MYDHILIPVDGSPFSEEVIPYARGIAATTGAKISLLRIVEDDSKRVDAEASVERLASSLGVEFRVVAGHGDVADGILHEASDPSTLIAITSHGRGGILNVMLGSVARRIVHSSHTPVLVFRPVGKPISHDPIEITDVLLPLDGTSLSESMKPEAVTWARALNARLMIVQVLSATARAGSSPDAQDVLESSYVHSHARDISREFGVSADYEVLHGDPVEAISSFIGGRPHMLAVMATRQRTAFQAAVLGSVTSGLVRRSGIPLIVQAPDEVRQGVPPAG